MQVVILAAGKGERLNRLTAENTKCMVEINGVTLIERMLKQLDNRGLSRIVMVVGYKKDNLINFISKLNINTEIIYVENDVYEMTNNIYSLYLAKSFLCEEETIILESDIIFENGVLDLVFDNSGENIAVVDTYKSWMTGMGVTLDESGAITSFVKENGIDYSNLKKCYKTVGIYRFNSDFSKEYYIPFMEAYIKAFGKRARYEQVLRIIAMADEILVKAKCTGNAYWYEINDIQDIDLASTLFSEDEEKITALMLGRWGGYWRYPDYLDYFYLVTPYYPPKNMVEEMKANFEDLLVQYPSGMKVNALLAAKEFAVLEENIVIGNGAAELIKSMMETLKGVTGFVRPTFDEYPNRFLNDGVINYNIENDEFSYNAGEVIAFFDDKDIANLVLVNPDNPSGNYIKKQDMLELLAWAKGKNIKVIIDESFVDFVDEEKPTLINQAILDEFPGLYVIKSISKSYGVPGLRLGVLASGDREKIAWMKKDVAIWNINSFAEFYMQIAGKYKADYITALEKFRKERTRFQKLLREIEGLRVIDSQANYVMVELKNGINSDILKRRMLIDKKVFIKSLSKKIGGDRQYIRLAIRDEKDNDRLLEALKEILSQF